MSDCNGTPVPAALLISQSGAGTASDSATPRVTKKYAEARNEIGNADLLLFRQRDWYTRAIAVAGRSEYVHAGMAGWWDDDLMLLEQTNGGGRAELLSNVVARFPGAIDVYSIRDDITPAQFSRAKSMRAMKRITGRPYGRLRLLFVALLHLPIVRWFVPVRQDEAEGETFLPPFCSEAVSYSDREGGMDPVPNLPDRLTEPGDLARSSMYRYHFTLIP
jgi:hypothetical protein